MTHDYKRNGTTTLFAALNILNCLSWRMRTMTTAGMTQLA
jgi:hypothetical protein